MCPFVRTNLVDTKDYTSLDGSWLNLVHIYHTDSAFQGQKSKVKVKSKLWNVSNDDPLLILTELGTLAVKGQV